MNKVNKKITKHVQFTPDKYKPVAMYLEETGLTFTAFMKKLIKKELNQSV